MVCKLVAMPMVSTLLLDWVPPEERDPRWTTKRALTTVAVDTRMVEARGAPAHIPTSILARDVLILAQSDLLDRVKELKPRGPSDDLRAVSRDLAHVSVALMKLGRYLRDYVPPLTDQPDVIARALGWISQGRVDDVAQAKRDVYALFALGDANWGVIADHMGPRQSAAWLPFGMERLRGVGALLGRLDQLRVETIEGSPSNGVDQDHAYRARVAEIADGHNYHADPDFVGWLEPNDGIESETGQPETTLEIYPAPKHFFQTLDTALDVLNSSVPRYSVRVPIHSPFRERTLVFGKASPYPISVKVMEKDIEALARELNEHLDCVAAAVAPKRPAPRTPTPKPAGMITDIFVSPKKSARRFLGGRVGIAMSEMPSDRRKVSHPYHAAGMHRDSSGSIFLSTTGLFGPIVYVDREEPLIDGVQSRILGALTQGASALRSGVTDAQRILAAVRITKRDRRRGRSGATFVALEFTPDGTFHVYHAGDFRAYLFTKGELQILTKDQAEQPEEIARMEMIEDALTLPLRGDTAMRYHEAIRKSEDALALWGGIFAEQGEDPTYPLGIYPGLGTTNLIPPMPGDLFLLVNQGVTRHLPWNTLSRFASSVSSPIEIARMIRDAAVEEMPHGEKDRALVVAFRI